MNAVVTIFGITNIVLGIGLLALGYWFYSGPGRTEEK